MVHDLSPEEVRQEHLDVLGPELGPLYYALYNEVVWLYAKWYQFRELFGHSPDRVRLLNRAGSFFFFVLDEVFWHDVLLHIARLVDSPKTGGKTNLTLQSLHTAIADDTLAEEIRVRVEDAVSRCQFARDWRNRRLAHKDLSLSLESSAKPLELGSRKDVEQCLAAFASILNAVGMYYFNTQIRFDPLVTGDAKSVVRCLEKGLERSISRQREIE